MNEATNRKATVATLVERLRDDTLPATQNLCDEAADEIERLQKEVALYRGDHREVRLDEE